MCAVQRCYVVSAVFSFFFLLVSRRVSPESVTVFPVVSEAHVVAGVLAVEGELSWDRGTSREFVAQCSAPPESASSPLL